MEKTNIISKIKERFREKKVFYTALISILVTAIVTATGTYAWFSSEASSNATLVTTGTLSVTFDQGRIISANNIKPATREQVLESYNAGNCKYNNESYNEQICYANTFTITNTGDITAVVTASLTEVTNTFTSYLKYEVFESTPSSLTGQSIGTNTNLVGLPTNVSIPAVTNNTKTYTILIWLDSSATIETDANKSYTSTISVRAVQTNYDGEVEEIPLDESCIEKIERGELVTYCVTSRQALQEDPSGANRPELADGMIPIVYDDVEQRWEKANAVGSYDEWYDYPNKKWANAVMVTNETRDTYMDADIGTPVLEADILAYFVWIPRYKYLLFNPTYASGTSPQVINIVFETETDSTGTVTCSYSDTGVETCTNKAVGNFYTHPAFTFGSKELKGLWVGKFETTGDIINPTIKPNLIALNYQTVSTFFSTAREFGTSNYLTTEGVDKVNSHMMKNIEWGAVAYLKQSIYGLGITEIYMNNSVNNSTYMGYTGRSGGAIYGPTSTYGTYSYDGRICSTASCTTEQITAISRGTGASTTGNITGIYDMSGGGEEYVMGNYQKLSEQSGLTVTGLENKYYDLYAGNGVSYSHLGDALGETAGWYNDAITFVNNSYPWFYRGGRAENGNWGGLFYFSYYLGSETHFTRLRSILAPM